MISFKDSLFKILSIILGIFLGIAIIELCAWAYLEQKEFYYSKGQVSKNQHPHIGRKDKDLGWGLDCSAEGRSSTLDFDIIYSTNSNGLRDSEFFEEKPKGIFRIVALGESNVFGEGVAYGSRFTEVIESYFRKVEVMNLGIWGFGIDQSLLQLQRDGFAYNPDLVILFLIESSIKRIKDYKRSSSFKPRFILDEHKENLILQDAEYFKSKFGCQESYIKNSSLYKLIRLYKRTRESVGKTEERLYRDHWENIQKMLDKQRKLASDSYISEDYEKIVSLILKEYRDSCAEKGAKFLVVSIFEWKLEHLDKMCSDLGIDYLDLSGILQQASKLQSLHFKVDRHYNEYAHEVIGKSMSGYLQETLVLVGQN